MAGRMLYTPFVQRKRKKNMKPLRCSLIHTTSVSFCIRLHSNKLWKKKHLQGEWFMLQAARWGELVTNKPSRPLPTRLQLCRYEWSCGGISQRSSSRMGHLVSKPFPFLPFPCPARAPVGLSSSCLLVRL